MFFHGFFSGLEKINKINETHTLLLFETHTKNKVLHLKHTATAAITTTKNNNNSKMLSNNLLTYDPAFMWVDILWLTFVIVVSPIVFMLTMAINELPVLMVRRVVRFMRTEPKRFQSIPLGSICDWLIDNRQSQ